MNPTYYPVEAMTPFAESLLWQINREYYQHVGIEAWTSGLVPHHLTSNAMVGKTYASLILGLLTDLALQGKNKEKVYIVELGAGHGRLGFYILQELEIMAEQSAIELPPYCYVLSDIVQKNLDFFDDHENFQGYFQKGQLDLAYLDAMVDEDIVLVKSGVVLSKGILHQPVVVIANYFFDSIPQHLFYLSQGTVASCQVALDADVPVEEVAAGTLLPHLRLRYDTRPTTLPYFNDEIPDQVLASYAQTMQETCLLLPLAGMRCLTRMRQLSTAGAMVLTMDKGNHLAPLLDHRPMPDYVTHGSFSLNVNYHALAQYTELTGGNALFPEASNFNLELGCLLWLGDSNGWKSTLAAYTRFVDDYGPDDFFSLTRMVYPLADQLTLRDTIALLRLSGYDTVFFINLLPWFKQQVKQVTYAERSRISETLHKIWKRYFHLNDTLDLAFEMAGIFYDLGYYDHALLFFGHSEKRFGASEDSRYNTALCLYQLRRDEELIRIINTTLIEYPHFQRMEELKKLEL